MTNQLFEILAMFSTKLTEPFFRQKVTFVESKIQQSAQQPVTSMYYARRTNA